MKKLDWKIETEPLAPEDSRLIENLGIFYK